MPVFPLFSSCFSRSRDSLTMPDYYRTTRVEDYGPYLRTAQSSPDLYTRSGAMTRESQEDRCSFLLPDFDDGEFGSGSDTEDRYKRNRFQVFERVAALFKRRRRKHSHTQY